MDLFISGFPLDLDEAKLINLFEIYGINVKSAKIIKHHSTGFSRGFGFVAIENKEEAKLAMSKINGQFLEGSRLIVKEARPAKFVHKKAYNLPERWKEKADCEGEL